MKTNGKKINGIVLCLLELLLGVLLLIKPVGFTSGIIIGAGVFLMLKGLKDIIAYFRAPAEVAAMQQSLSGGLIALLLGGFCAFQYQWIMLAVPFLGVIYAVMLVLLGMQKIQSAVDLKRMGYARWYWMAISAAISIICGVIIFANPFATAAYLWMFTGISLIVEAAADLASMLLNGRKA